MELRIPINNRRKQFAGISRDYLSDFQDGVQYQFPYPVRDGQFKSIPCGFTEERTDGLVCLKPLHRTKYVILHHGQRKAGNLRREVYTLTSAKVKQLLAIVICHLSSPTSSISPICLKETEREIRGEQSVPLTLSATPREEQTYGSSCKLYIYSAVGALQRPVMLGESLLLELFDNLFSRQVPPLGVVLGFAKFDHTNQMTLDVSAGNKTNEVCTGKPAVNEQIVESDAALDGVLHHLNGLFNLRHRILLDALLDALPRIVSRETLAALLIRQPLLLVWLTAFFAMKREIEEQLAHAVAQKQRQTFITKDALMLDMGEHLTDELTLTTALGSVSVIDNQADRSFMRGLCASTDLAQQLEIHSIQKLAPLDITVIHKTIEHVFLTTEQAA